MANVFEDRIDIRDVKHMNFDPGEYERYQLHDGDVLLNEGQSPELLGRPAIYRGIPADICFTNTLIRFQAGAGVDPRWALAVFRRHMHAGRFARESRITTNIAHLSLNRLREVEFPVPPLAEQRRVVDALDDHLSRLDAAVALLEAARKRTTNARLAVMRLAGLGVLGADLELGARVDLADAGTHDDALPGLPEGWRWKRLGEVAEVVGGVTKDANKQSGPTYVETPYLRVANVLRGRLDLSKVTTLRVPPAKAIALALEPGDLLLNEGGDRDKLGRGWIWEGQIPGCIHQNHVFRARLHDGVYADPRLLAWFTNTYGQAWCDRNAKQSVNLASISLSKIRLLPVPVPPADAQLRAIKQADAAFESLGRLEAATEIATARGRSLRRSLLDAAFSGRLVSQDAADEPAELLLQRIAAEREALPRKRAVRRPRAAQATITPA